MIKAVILGNLGKDPESRTTPQGDLVCSFNVASTEKVKNKDGDYVDNTCWVKVSLFGRVAENACKYLVKGSKVLVDGNLSEEKWTDRDGNERVSLVLNRASVQFLSSSQEPKVASATASATTTTKKTKNPFEGTVDGDSDEFADTPF